MGDDTSTIATPSTSTKQSTQDLLADIFGSSNEESISSVALSSSNSVVSAGKSSVNDILGLFDSASISSSPVAHQISTSSSGSLFDSAPISAPSPPIVTQAKSYVAYESNGLKITLEPKKDPNRDNVLNVLVRFEAVGLAAGERFEEVGFMAAVPKVRFRLLSRLVTLTILSRHKNYRC